MAHPLIAVTCGDPAGVGPELCLKLVETPSVIELCRPIIFGDASILSRVATSLGLPLPCVIEKDAELASVERSAIVDLGCLTEAMVTPGVVSESTGEASYRYIITAIELAKRGDVAAVVTGPINKEALHAAKIPHPGHTEILASETGAQRICMMLTADDITCSLVTTHVGLNEVASLLSVDRILDAIELSHQAMVRIRGRAVRLAVCGLNPHAGEGGLFGDREEERLITPAVRSAREKGIDVVGPLPPDTAFLPSIRKSTDCYVCMYHDQGLIPLKTLAFDTAVNITLGLPIVRTSVDHGTALDIAWQGTASVSSFVKAVELAVQLTRDSE